MFREGVGVLNKSIQGIVTLKRELLVLKSLFRFYEKLGWVLTVFDSGLFALTGKMIFLVMIAGNFMMLYVCTLFTNSKRTDMD